MPPAPRSSAGSSKRIKCLELRPAPSKLSGGDETHPVALANSHFSATARAGVRITPAQAEEALALFWRRLNLGPGLFRFPGFELLE